MRDPSRVQVAGPLAPYSAGFCGELARRGYAPDSATRHLHLMANASRWLAVQALLVDDLTPTRLGLFVTSRRESGYTGDVSPRRLMRYLRSVGAAPEPTPAGPATGVEELLERYRCYLVRERSLAASTVRPYMRFARVFVSWFSRDGELELERLTTAEVSRLVLAECRHRSRGSSYNVVVTLRSLLRFLHVEGITACDLTGAVPAVAPQARSLPHALSARTVARLLASCDRDSPTGRRDLAILLLLARLGLRAGEVAAIELPDVDWERGELLVRGKGNRRERLPLPVDVGQALAAYVQHGRPTARDGRLFMRVYAPITGLTGDGVSGVVGSACRRCGLPLVGAHALRHTVATEVLRRGGSLREIGELLRQRSEFTTAVYAKVDLVALRELARVWPGGVS